MKPSPWRAFVCTLLLAMAASAAAIGLGERPFDLRGLAAAWIVTGAHGSALFLIHFKAIASPSKNFLRWGLGMNGVRVLLLLAVIFCCRSMDRIQFEPFLGAVLIGYFCFLFSDVYFMHAVSLQSEK